jgi:hypothetical protein
MMTIRFKRSIGADRSQGENQSYVLLFVPMTYVYVLFCSGGRIGKKDSSVSTMSKLNAT